MNKIFHWNLRFGNSIGGGEIYLANIIQNMPEFNHYIVSDQFFPKPNIEFYGQFEEKIIYSTPPNFIAPRVINFPINILAEMVRYRNKKNISNRIKPELNVFHGLGLFGPLERLKFSFGIDLINYNYFQQIEPKILTVHNLYSPLFKVNNKNHKSYENKLFEQFDTFICVDKNIYSFLKKKCDSKNIYYIPNSIPDYFFDIKTSKRKFNPSSPVFGFVGRYEYSRGIHILKDFISQSPRNFKFVLIFSAKRSLKERIEKEMASFKNIELHFNIPNKELIDYYQKMDFTINPVLAKGISRVTLEAMACAAIPIMLNLGDRYPVINDETGILFHEKDLSDLITRIQEITPERQKIMQKNGLNIVQEFSNSRIIPKLIEVYTKSFFKLDN
jgi:glycosyltransferase involved in cell wall biosynthesis